MMGIILMWLAYMLTAFVIENQVAKSKRKWVGLVGLSILSLSFGFYAIVGAIINGKI